MSVVQHIDKPEKPECLTDTACQAILEQPITALEVTKPMPHTKYDVEDGILLSRACVRVCACVCV